MPYESVQHVSPNVTVHYARSTPTFWGSHYVLCLHGSTGTHRATFARILDEFDTSTLTLVAMNTPDRPNGFIPLPPTATPITNSTTNGASANRQSTSGDSELFDGGDEKKRSWTQLLERNAEHAVTMMQNLFYTPFSIIAHEDGAITALHLAAKHHSYVRSVVVWAAVPKITNRHMQALNDSRFMSPANSKHNPFFQDDDRRVFLERLQSNGDPQVSVAVLHKIDCPVLILQSRNDPLSTTDQALYLTQNLSNARVVTCDGATTDFHVNNFAWFKQQVHTFLTELDD